VASCGATFCMTREYPSKILLSKMEVKKKLIGADLKKFGGSVSASGESDSSSITRVEI
jgi:hypothetical protein